MWAFLFRQFCIDDLDVKLLERWYLFEEKLSPSVYKLKDPDENFTNILSRSLSTYDLNTRENQEWNEAYTILVDLFLSVLYEKSNSKSTYDIPLLSSVEMLFNFSTKLSSSGCMCILRQFDGMFRDFYTSLNCFEKKIYLVFVALSNKRRLLLGCLTSHLDHLSTFIWISLIIYIHHLLYIMLSLLRHLYDQVLKETIMSFHRFLIK